MTIYAQEISRAIEELSENLALGALDADGYEERANKVAREADMILRSGETSFSISIGELELSFPIMRFGSTITSLNLFDYKELSVFAIYWMLHGKVERFLDLGSNIGTHSVVMAKLGATVRSYEPDNSVSRIHREITSQHGLNSELIDAAAGIRRGRASFVHIDDNQTGSHVLGKKPDPYGPLTRFEVQVEDCRPDIDWADLVKMDVEGSESEILSSTSGATLSNSLIICEVTSPDSAQQLFDYLSKAPVRMFVQATGWLTPSHAHKMPSHHSGGSLLIVGDSSTLSSGLKLEELNF